jgi:UDP-2,3-diacylglucosamine hydrolase
VADARGALPAAAVWRAPDTWQAIDFISDLHLSAGLPRTFDAWSAYLRGTAADAVVILGDLFEFWPGSDALQMAFESRCFDLLRDAAQRRHVALMVGNRDFLLTPALLREHGLHPVADPTLLQAFDRRVLLTHGDALCLADVAYQQFRAWARDPATQADFLARPLAERVQVGAQVRHASEAGRQQPPPGGWPDLDAAAAAACLQAAGAATMVHGHTHRPGDSMLAPGFERHVLSDWFLDATAGDDAPRAEVLRLRAGGFMRLAPQAAAAAL